MKKGFLIAIGLGVVVISMAATLGSGYTPAGLPEIGGIPDPDNNQMTMSDEVSVKVTRGDGSTSNESTPKKQPKGSTIEVNLNDGAGSNDKN